MHIDDITLKRILIDGSFVTREDIETAEHFAQEHHAPFVEYLFTEDLVSKDLIGQATAEWFGFPYADLNSAAVSSDQVKTIPEEIAKKYHAILFAYTETTLTVTTDDPANAELLPALQAIFPQYEIRIAYSLTEDIGALFVHYQKPLETRFAKIIAKQDRVAPELLEEIFEDALVYRASDIHFEPQGKEIVIRFRVDGVLHETGRIPKEYYENILNRVKVKSNLRIDEHFAAQDGSLQHGEGGKLVDMRVSIAPTVEGEKVVFRILSSHAQRLTLSDLGLTQSQQNILSEAAQRPFGMILVVGPTGSGKTTTLYALLKLLNNPDVNITTIEDPVEYKVQNISQIQVNQQTGLTFAKGLRSIVRQDPDIILVGEIRDQETAEIAVNAALTGHLLLSTFHANDAATAIPRLIDMNIEPFLLASTLNIVAAQRLVRTICGNCRYSVTLQTEDFDTTQLRASMPYFPSAPVTLYKGKGCESCHQTGYKGRTSIFEFIPITPSMQEFIGKKPSSQDIWKLARQEGAKSIFEDGIERVKNGVTTLEELLRVAEPPKNSAVKA
jgi:type IV pilus assembly protein PilB